MGRSGKIRPYAGLKEEYYLADFTPDSGGPRRAGARSGSARSSVIRTPPEVSLYHRFANDLFADVLARARDAAARDGAQIVVLPRTAAQRAELSTRPRLRRPAPRDRRPVA